MSVSVTKKKKTVEPPPTEPKMKLVSADWKDTSGMFESFIDALREFGLYAMEPDALSGSDSFSVVISNRPLTQEIIEEEFGFSQR